MYRKMRGLVRAFDDMRGAILLYLKEVRAILISEIASRHKFIRSDLLNSSGPFRVVETRAENLYFFSESSKFNLLARSCVNLCLSTHTLSAYLISCNCWKAERDGDFN